jgi:hypothetical protein
MGQGSALSMDVLLGKTRAAPLTASSALVLTQSFCLNLFALTSELSGPARAWFAAEVNKTIGHNRARLRISL